MASEVAITGIACRGSSEEHYSLVSEREAQIIKSLIVGATAREIAKELQISFHTVRTHIRNIYQKLGVANRIELLRWTETDES